MDSRKPQTPLIFILKSLIPYSRENLLLGLSPNRYFNELEKLSGYKRRTLQQAAWRAEQQGLIEKQRNRTLKLTELGERRVKPYFAEKLGSGAQLMVAFDIPEKEALARRQLRNLLKKWKFEQVQKSVWITGYDFRSLLGEAVKELEIEDYVRVYECELVTTSG